LDLGHDESYNDTDVFPVVVVMPFISRSLRRQGTFVCAAVLRR
jgi:hypothetical protein